MWLQYDKALKWKLMMTTRHFLKAKDKSVHCHLHYDAHQNLITRKLASQYPVPQKLGTWPLSIGLSVHLCNRDAVYMSGHCCFNQLASLTHLLPKKLNTNRHSYEFYLQPLVKSSPLSSLSSLSSGYFDSRLASKPVINFCAA